MSRVAFVALQFKGHFDAIHELALATRKHCSLTLFVCCGWECMETPHIDDCLKSVVLTSKEAPTSAPTEFNPRRALALIEPLIDVLRKHCIERVVYDFFCLEAYVASHVLRIPCACSIPAILWDSSVRSLTDAGITTGLDACLAMLTVINHKYGTQIVADKPVSDGFLVPGDWNIIWVPREVYKGCGITLPPNTVSLATHSPPLPPPPHPLSLPPSDEKTAYVSLGTVVTGNLWKCNPTARDYIRDVYIAILSTLMPTFSRIVVADVHRHEDVRYIADRLYQYRPGLADTTKIEVFPYVNQRAVLAEAALCVFHGGGNTLAQAIAAAVPMVVIPFFGDQYATAAHVARTGIGASATLPGTVPADTLQDYSLRQISPIHKAIEAVIRDLPAFTAAVAALRALAQPCPIAGAFSELLRQPMAHWRTGDLLFGSSVDRRAFIETLGLTSVYQLGNLKPFTTWSTDELPRLVDQYNDALSSAATARHEMNATTPLHMKYAQWLREYHTFLRNHPEHFPADREFGPFDIDTIGQMCVGGLDFFINEKGVHVHFLLKSVPDVSRATLLELRWVIANADQPRVRSQIHFYGTDFLLMPFDAALAKVRHAL